MGESQRTMSRGSCDRPFAKPPDTPTKLLTLLSPSLNEADQNLPAEKQSLPQKAPRKKIKNPSGGWMANPEYESWSRQKQKTANRRPPPSPVGKKGRGLQGSAKGDP